VSGLRVYIRAVVAHADGGISAFYSRKGGGPFYQWLYDDKLGVWRCSRLNSSVLTPQAFYVASWKSLPTSLRTRLSEHYLE
jgi:hypothetical protein